MPASTLTLYDLLPDVLGRIEEDLPPGYSSPSGPPNPAGAPDGPVFWHLKGEVYVQMVDSLFMANLLTGFYQVQDVPVTIAANQTYFELQNNEIINIPAGAFAALRMKAPYQIRKTSQAALDAMHPGWQQEAPSDQIRRWFPLGISYFGISPQVAHEQTVIMDFLVCPVNQSRPYNGLQTVPFPQQFYDLLTTYAAVMLRSKEGGAEAEEADTVFAAYTERTKALSLFQGRIDSVDYTAAQGAALIANPRKTM